MGKTSIEWVQGVDGMKGFTWNPIRGCSKISPGCEHCYAAEIAARFSGPGETYEGLAKRGPTNWTGELRFIEDKLFEPLRRRAPTTYFVNSMSDLFHEKLPEPWIDLIFAAMYETPRHTFQVLTKRAERAQAYLSHPERRERVAIAVKKLLQARDSEKAKLVTIGDIYDDLQWPLPDVWLGVSVEDQQRADERIPHLLETPAAVRFLSCEPLLGNINLDNWLDDPVSWANGRPFDWVIVGGESGRNARKCDTDWIRRIVIDCQLGNVACFVKQLGSHVIDTATCCAGTFSDEWPADTKSSFFEGDATHLVYLKDKKGGDPAEWPESLRVRKMPPQPAEALA